MTLTLAQLGYKHQIDFFEDGQFRGLDGMRGSSALVGLRGECDRVARK